MSAAQPPARAEFGVAPEAVHPHRAARVIALTILLHALIVRVGFQSTDISIVFNGETLAGPEERAVEGWVLLVAVVALFYAATRRRYAEH